MKPKEDFKILLVEDVKITQKTTLIMLQGLGHEVDVAGTGKEAIELFRNKEYNLVLLDLGLPDMDGFKVAENMQALSKGSNIAALTAHGDEAYKTRCYEAGIKAFWVKPLKLELVAEFISSHQEWGL